MQHISGEAAMVGDGTAIFVTATKSKDFVEPAHIPKDGPKNTPWDVTFAMTECAKSHLFGGEGMAAGHKKLFNTCLLKALEIVGTPAEREKYAALAEQLGAMF
jgi:hypothetical protein